MMTTLKYAIYFALGLIAILLVVGMGVTMAFLTKGERPTEALSNTAVTSNSSTIDESTETIPASQLLSEDLPDIELSTVKPTEDELHTVTNPATTSNVSPSHDQSNTGPGADDTTGANLDTATDPTETTTIASPADETNTRLFIDAITEGDVDTPNDPTIVRTRFVKINFDLLGGANSLSQSQVNDVITLNLFDDITFTAILDRVEPTQSGDYTWSGHLEGYEDSRVTLVVKEGIMVGNITLFGELYQVRYTGNDVHAIHEIDQTAFPDEDEPPGQ